MAAKKTTATEPYSTTWVALAGMTKNALMDCLADAIALQNGCEPSDITAEMVATFCDPRLKVRGDKTVNTKGRKLPRGFAAPST